MANPLWKIGQPSANPGGRPKHSARSIKGMLENFVRRNITPNRLKVMFEKLSPRDQAEFLTALLPYTLPRVKEDALSNDEAKKLVEMIQEKFKKEEHGKAS